MAKKRKHKTQQNSKCRLCSDRDETIDHIISECSKLAQKEYKTRHESVGKEIHWEMYKKFKFDHTNNGIENNTHKLLWDFVIHTDRQILTRRRDQIIINNNKKKRELANC